MQKHVISIEERISYLESRIKYFEYWMAEKPLFLPEYKVSKEILEVIESSDKTDESKLRLITTIYNKITLVEHYNSSGWLDSQLLLEGYFNHFGYCVDFDKETGSMLVTKNQ